MAIEECLSKEKKIINDVAYFNIFDWKKWKHSIYIKMIKSLKLNLRFMLPRVSSLSFKNDYLNLLIINLTITTYRNLIKGCNCLLSNLTLVRIDLLLSRFHKIKKVQWDWKIWIGRIWFGKVTFSMTHLSTLEENYLNPFTCNRNSNQFTVDHETSVK